MLHQLIIQSVAADYTEEARRRAAHASLVRQARAEARRLKRERSRDSYPERRRLTPQPQ